MKFEPIIPNECEHMTLEEFIKECKRSAYTDDDGYGYLATEKEMSDIKIHASEYRFLNIFLNVTVSNWVTHIVWFNK